MQLCDRLESSSYGAAQCYVLVGGCQGAQINNCYPYSLWAQTPNGKERYHGYMAGGILYSRVPNESRLVTMGHGLRCVLDLIMPFGTAFITTDYWVCKGLQLCDAWESSNYGAAQCLTLNGSCQGSNNNHCYPYGIWSGAEAGTDIYYNRELKRGDFTTLNACDGSARCVARFAFGVRCVLDLYILFCRVFIRKQYRQICSCATSGRAISTVLHSVILFMTAVRAQAGETQGGMTIAGLLSCGPAAAVILYITEGI